MIDNPDQTDRPLAKLDAALPVSARMTPELAAALQAPNPAQNCTITWISYAGDEGGIVCGLDLAQESNSATVVSITHLRFHPNLPLARDIAAYQKHRAKRLRRQLP
jgi:hypothetical protein